MPDRSVWGLERVDIGWYWWSALCSRCFTVFFSFGKRSGWHPCSPSLAAHCTVSWLSTSYVIHVVTIVQCTEPQIAAQLFVTRFMIMSTARRAHLNYTNYCYVIFVVVRTLTDHTVSAVAISALKNSPRVCTLQRKGAVYLGLLSLFN